MKTTLRAALLLPAASLGAASFAGCSLPERNNVHDSSLRPTVLLEVTLGAGGEPVVRGERWQPLTLDASKSSVSSGEITRVIVERLDARSAGTDECPLLEPRVIAEIDGPGAVPWTDHTDICFAQETEDDEHLYSIPLRLRATAYTSRGAKESRELDFVLANAAPASDPGPTLWIDPIWGMTATLSNAGNVDLDDAPVITWEQIAGPPVTLASTDLPTFTVDLAGDDPAPEDRYGAGFRFRVTTCDPWQCSDPANLDVVLRPAVWAATGNGLLLLDGTFTTASMLDDDETATPVQLNGSPVARFAPAIDGLWMFRPSSNVARHIRADFTARQLPQPLPAIFQEIAGVSNWGAVWILVGPGAGPYQILELGPDDTYTDTFASVNTQFSQSMLTRTYISQVTPDGNLWAAGYEAGQYRMMVFPPGQAARELNAYSGEPLYDCMGDTEIRSITADPDGGLWVFTELSITRLTADAELVACTPVDELSFGYRTDAIALPQRDGSSRLIYTRPAADLISDPELWTLEADGTERLFADIPAGNFAYDPLQHRIVVLSRDGVTSYDADDDLLNVPIAYVPMSEIFPGRVFDLFGTSIDLSLDRAGRPWVFYREGTTTAMLARLPESLRLVRAEIDQAGVLDYPALGGVDPRSGAIWVAEVTTSGDWVAAAYDERGAIENGRVPIPSGTTGTPIYDGVRGLRFDPGDTSRAPGFWVHYNVAAAAGGAEFRIARVALDGSIVASFGGPGEEPAGGFPNESAWLYFGVSAIVDPGDGALWLSIHDDNLADARLGEAYRLGANGSIQRFDAVSTLRTDGFSTVASPGGLMLTGGNTLQIVRVTDAGTTSTNACFGGDQAGSVSYDAGSDEAVLFCWTDDPEDGWIPSYTTRWDVSTGLQITALRSPTTLFTRDPVTGNLLGRQDAVTGTYWAPEEFGLRMYDRFLQDTGHYPVPARIRYMVQ